MAKKFSWHHPAITNYIAECKGLRIYWKTMTTANLKREAEYVAALNTVRKYLDGVGLRMPKIRYEDIRIERMMFNKD